ncbi:MAG: DUF1295 domain-containing protein [Hyphomicrobiaceae bacterium]
MTWQALLMTVLVQWLVFAAVMAGAWLLRRRTGNSGFVDACWSLGLGAVAAAGAIAPVASNAEPLRQGIVAGLVLLWSIRLGAQIVQRALHSEDDPRYAALAEGWGGDAERRMFLFLQAQAAVSVPMLLAVTIAAHRPGAAPDLMDLGGIALLLAAIAGEGIADRQLWHFRRDPANRGKVCDRGLWSWSRHPNYFFEWLAWLAYPLIAISTAGGYPIALLALGAPVTMYVLLVHVSGIPLLEAHMLESRGDAYRRYQERTSAFFPLPPSRQG